VANPRQFKALKKLPAKIRVQRNDDIVQGTTFVFIKNGEVKNYYFVKDKACEPVSFVKMAKHLKVSPMVQGIQPLRTLHYEQVATAVETYERELATIVQTSNTTRIDNATDKKAMRLLKSWFNKGVIDKEMFNIFKKILETGRLLNLGKQIKALEKKTAHEIITTLEQLQVKYDIQEEEQGKVHRKREVEVILSETIMKG